MAVQLKSITVTLPSVGLSLTLTTLQLPWSGESLLFGVTIPESTATGGSTVVSSNAGTHALVFSGSSNSMYVPLMAGIG